MIFSTWAHGNVTVAEHPAGGALNDVDGRNYTAVVGYPTGWGKQFEGSGAINITDTWFHIPIPTPTLANSNPVFIDQVFLLFTSTTAGVEGGSAGIPQIDLWDGPNRIAQMPTVHYLDGTPYGGTDLLLLGDWSALRTETDDAFRTTISNTFTPRDSANRRIRILFGLNMSIKVKFGGNGKITFMAAGVNWSDQQ